MSGVIKPGAIDESEIGVFEQAGVFFKWWNPKCSDYLAVQLDGTWPSLSVAGGVIKNLGCPSCEEDKSWVTSDRGQIIMGAISYCGIVIKSCLAASGDINLVRLEFEKAKSKIWVIFSAAVRGGGETRDLDSRTSRFDLVETVLRTIQERRDLTIELELLARSHHDSSSRRIKKKRQRITPDFGDVVEVAIAGSQISHHQRVFSDLRVNLESEIIFELSRYRARAKGKDLSLGAQAMHLISTMRAIGKSESSLSVALRQLCLSIDPRISTVAFIAACGILHAECFPELVAFAEGNSLAIPGLFKQIKSLRSLLGGPGDFGDHLEGGMHGHAMDRMAFELRLGFHPLLLLTRNDVIDPKWRDLILLLRGVEADPAIAKLRQLANEEDLTPSLNFQRGVLEILNCAFEQGETIIYVLEETAKQDKCERYYSLALKGLLALKRDRERDAQKLLSDAFVSEIVNQRHLSFVAEFLFLIHWGLQDYTEALYVSQKALERLGFSYGWQSSEIRALIALERHEEARAKLKKLAPYAGIGADFLELIARLH